MVEAGAAQLGVEDTTRVELEDESVSFNGNGDGAGSNGNLELVGVVLNNIGEAGGLDGGDLGSLVVASLINSDVGVFSLSHHAKVSGILEALVHPATVATLVAVAAGAIDKLLLRQVKEVSTLDLPSAFHSDDSGEGPA